MLKRLVVCVVVSAVMMLPVPVQATTTVKRLSLIGMTGGIAYPGKLFFNTGTTSGMYRISMYATVSQANNGSASVNWYCPTAFASSGGSWPFSLSAVGSAGYAEQLGVLNASLSCYYWLSFQATSPVTYDLYLTVEKI
jgi:hypothetical protein